MSNYTNVIIELRQTQLDFGKPLEDDVGMEWTRAWGCIDARRTELGMSKADLYSRTGISESTFRKMAQGVPLVRAENATKIGLALGWPVDWLDSAGRGEQPQPASSGGDSLDRLQALVAELTERVERLADRVAQHDDQLVSLTKRAGSTRRQSARVH